MRLENLTVSLLLALVLMSAPVAGRARRPAPDPADDQPVTRAEAAKAIEPLLDAHTTKDGRLVTAQDVANLEYSSLHVSDETVQTEARVVRLQAEIEDLRREIRELQRRRHRLIVP